MGSTSHVVSSSGGTFNRLIIDLKLNDCSIPKDVFPSGFISASLCESTSAKACTETEDGYSLCVGPRVCLQLGASQPIQVAVLSNRLVAVYT